MSKAAAPPSDDEFQAFLGFLRKYGTVRPGSAGDAKHFFDQAARGVRSRLEMRMQKDGSIEVVYSRSIE